MNVDELLCKGEDRWLCTLLLQRGYRVEYSAASDAYTHCPEGFNEFFQQRRRWVPSTMANIMDLLGDYKRTIQINDNISLPYILYQVSFEILTEAVFISVIFIYSRSVGVSVTWFFKQFEYIVFRSIQSLRVKIDF